MKKKQFLFIFFEDEFIKDFIDDISFAKKDEFWRRRVRLAIRMTAGHALWLHKLKLSIKQRPSDAIHCWIKNAQVLEK